MLTNKEAVEQLRNLKKANFYSSTIMALDMAINALNQTTWIPVGERLPSQSGEYLVTTSCEGATWTDKFEYTPTDRGWSDPEAYDDIIDWNDGGVIAWMPLPEAYKGGDNND